MPKLTKPGFAGRGKVKKTLYVNLMDNWLFLNASLIKSVSFREERLLYMSHFLNQSMFYINVSITALKGPEVVRKINKKFWTKNNPFGGCF